MRSICVFCGSSLGANGDYAVAAKRLGEHLARNGMSLVYGGANVGLMKILAEAALENGGEVIGIMPRRLVDREVAHLDLTTMHIVEGMSDRKTMMVKLSDAFITLPGGFGTFDELAEVITYNQLRLTDKPIGILNINGYYDKLLEFFNHATAEKFLRQEHRDNLIVEGDIEKLLDKMKNFRPVSMEKWIRDIREESSDMNHSL